jgi:hypothetical protein
VLGWFFGLKIAEMLFYDKTLDQWKTGSYIASLILSIAVPTVSGLSVWFVYNLFEWFIFGSYDKKPNDEHKNLEPR